MNSHFKKIRKGNTGKIGVWDIKKMKIKRGNVDEMWEQKTVNNC